MTRLLFNAALCLAVAAGLRGATLEKLTFDEMVAKSTAIVRARVGAAVARQHGPLLYTHHTLTVVESWKGPQSPSFDVVTPGGTLGKVQQHVPGAPVLPEGAELVLFLWTSPKGLTHVVGFAQGILQIERDANGQITLARASIAEGLFQKGRPTEDAGLRMSMTEFSTRVGTVLGRSR